MATNSHIQFGGARRRTLQIVALVFAASVIGAGHSKALPVYGFDEDDGRDTAAQSSDKPTVEAAFPRESYAPNSTAHLVITDKASTVSIQIRHVGPETGPIMGNDTMTGVPMTAKHTIGRVSGRRIVNVGLGAWPSGVYFVQLPGPGGRVGCAPFALAQRHPGAP